MGAPKTVPKSYRSTDEDLRPLFGLTAEQTTAEPFTADDRQTMLGP
jgi:hypothetical protein